MTQIVFEAREAEEGGYYASALGYPIHTQGEDWKDLEEMITDSVRGYFEDQEMPAIVRVIFVKETLLSA